ncbi:MAG: energy-coupling factor ABC transporter permease [Methanoregula sp.]|uniref:energy-coupling factor ABC transporter permease n=1 Tax=Methanoregula sp. TaxID=2052170 RepID=UPI003C1C0A6D
MAHIHLEDGSFSLFWVLTWWIIALCIVGVALFLLRSKNKPEKITIAAFVTAAAFAIFQIQIPIAGGVHLNLTPLIGILTGPVMGTLVIFIVNIFSAAIGHGGWGLIGANVIVNFTEVLVAWLTFRAMKRITTDLFSQAGVATFAGLFAGNLVMIAVILVSGIQGVHQTPAQILAGLSLLAAVNMGVAAIEAILTGFMVAYIGKVKPDILEGDRK